MFVFVVSRYTRVTSCSAPEARDTQTKCSALMRPNPTFRIPSLFKLFGIECMQTYIAGLLLMVCHSAIEFVCVRICARYFVWIGLMMCVCDVSARCKTYCLFIISKNLDVLKIGFLDSLLFHICCLPMLCFCLKTCCLVYLIKFEKCVCPALWST